MSAPGGGQAAAVWVSVLPDLSGFGRRLIDELGEAGQRGGEAAGNQAERGIAASAKKIAAAGAVIGAAVGVALVGAMNVEKANDKLTAQLGLTGKESERIGAVAGSLFSNAYGGSLEEVNGAVGAVISSIDGMRTASSATLDSVSRNALDFAAAFDTDVTAAVGLVGQLMRTGLAADATEGFDLITAASQKVPAAFREDVLAAAGEYGQFFATLGFDGEQSFALLVDAAAKGEFGLDKIGDAVKEFTIRSTDMSEASKTAYSAIGLDAETMANKILAGGDTAQGATQQIITGLLSMTNPSEQAAAAIALFGTPLEDLNVAEIPAFLTSMQGASTSMEGFEGAAGRLGTSLNDNAATNIESFKRQVTTAFIDIVGNRVLPIMSGFALFLATSFGPALDAIGAIMTSTVIPALTAFGGFLVDNRGPILFISGMIAAVFVPALIAMAVQSTITGVTTAAAWVMTQLGAIRAAAIHSGQVLIMVGGWILMGLRATGNALLVALAWVFIGSSAIAAAARSAVAFAVIMGQWLALAVQSQLQAARVVLAWLFSSTGPIAAAAVYVVQVAIMVGAWVLLGVQSLLAAARVAAAWLIAMGPIGLVIIAVVGLVALIIANWDTVKRVTEMVFTAVGNFLTTVWNGIVAVFNTSVAFLRNLWNTFWAGVQQVASTVWGAVSGFIASVWATIQTGFSTAVGFLSGLWNTFWTGVQQVATTVWNAVAAFISSVWGLIRAGFQVAVDFVVMLWDRFWLGLQRTSDTVFNAIRTIIDVVWTGIRVIFDLAVAALRFLWEAFWDGLRIVGETVFNAIRTMIDLVWAGIRVIFDLAVAAVRFLWEAFWNGLRLIGETVFNAIRTMIEFVWGLIQTGFRVAVDFISGMWSTFWTGLSTVASTVFNAIKSTIDTVIGGIIGAFRFVVDQVGVIWAGIKRLLAVPINFMIGTVYNGGIVKAWNFVAGLLGIGKINELPLIPEFRTGGAIPGRPDQPVPIMAHGNEHVWTDEEVRSAGGHAAVERLRREALNHPVGLTALNSGNVVEGADHDGQGSRRTGFGGVKPHVAQAGHFLQAKFGIGTVGGVGGRPGPSDHPSGHALDFMTYRDTGKGDRLSNYVVQNAAHLAVKYIIWKQRINSGGGWKGMEDRGSVTANHFDHPHVSFNRGPGGKDFSNGGDGGFLSFIGDQVRNLYNGATSGIPDAIRGLVGAPPPRFREIPPAMAATAIKSVGDFLFGKADAADESGLISNAYPVGSGVERWRPIVHQALGLVGQSRGFDDITLRRMNQESSGNPLAVNRTDINARRGTPSKGLMQVIDPTFRAHRHPATVNNVFDPLANVAASMRYALSRYGSLPSAYNRPGGYDNGGWMQPGFGTYFNGTSKPEAVLTNEQWKTVQAGAKGGDAPLIGSLSVQASPGQSPEQLIGAAMYEARRARRNRSRI